MEETGREIGPVKKQPLTGVLIELPDTPENQKKIGQLAQKLTTAITMGGAGIVFGVGLRGGKVVMKAEKLETTAPAGTKKPAKR